MQIFAAGDDNNGNPKVYSIWTDAADPTPLWSNWTDYGSLGENPPGDITLGLLPDTRTQIFYVDGANVVFTKWMTTKDPNTPWSDWSGLGSPGARTPQVDQAVTVGYLPDGRLQIFLFAYNGGRADLYTAWKTTTDPNAPWSGWASMGTPAVGVDQGWGNDLTVGYLPDGRLQIFYINSYGVYTNWKTTTDPNAPWTGWYVLGHRANINDIELGSLSDGRLQIFLLENLVGGTAWDIYTAWKTTTDPNAPWTNWTSIGNPGGIPGTSYPVEIRVASLPDGRLQIFCMMNDSHTVYTKWMTTTDPTAPWTDWGSMNVSGSPLDIVVLYDSQGNKVSLQAFTWSGGNVSTWWMTSVQPSVTWTGFTDLGSPPFNAVTRGLGAPLTAGYVYE